MYDSHEMTFTVIVTYKYSGNDEPDYADAMLEEKIRETIVDQIEGVSWSEAHLDSDWSIEVSPSWVRVRREN